MPNDFNPKTGGMISKEDANAWIQKYDDEDRKDKEKDTKSVFFGKDFLQEILNTEGAAGISFILAKKPNEFAKKDTVTLILVPRKEDGTLLWSTLPEGKDNDRGGAYDRGKICPPDC